VDAAFGTHVPQLREQCEFGTETSGGGVDTSKPVVGIADLEPSELRQRHEAAATYAREVGGQVVDRPSWGEGAFFVLQPSPTGNGLPPGSTETLIYLQKLLVSAEVPASIAEPRQVAEALGTAAAHH
jgi:hypothetical protein